MNLPRQCLSATGPTIGDCVHREGCQLILNAALWACNGFCSTLLYSRNMMGSVTDKYLLLLFSTLLSLWNWFWYQHLPLYLFIFSFVIPRLLFEAGNFLALQWMNLELQQAACNVLINKWWDWWLIGLNIWHVTKASLIALWHRSASEEDAEWEWVGNFIAFGKAQFSSDKNGKEICWLRASSNIFSVILWFRTILISETSSTSQFIFALHSTFNHKS